MKKIFTLVSLMFVFACARVSVEASKPIKVDITMRLDVYQHVEKDVNSIVDKIYEGKPKKLNAVFDLGAVYAADFSSDVDMAITRSQVRLGHIEEYLSKGYIGENKAALLVVLSGAPADVVQLVQEENNDREILYKSTAEKNGADISVVRKAFFDKHYQKAPAGASFEFCTASGCAWKNK